MKNQRSIDSYTLKGFVSTENAPFFHKRVKNQRQIDLYALKTREINEISTLIR